MSPRYLPLTPRFRRELLVDPFESEPAKNHFATGAGVMSPTSQPVYSCGINNLAPAFTVSDAQNICSQDAMPAHFSQTFVNSRNTGMKSFATYGGDIRSIGNAKKLRDMRPAAGCGHAPVAPTKMKLRPRTKKAALGYNVDKGSSYLSLSVSGVL